MVTHYILMSSSYSLGKRIALDYVPVEKIDYTKLRRILDTIVKECGEDVSVSTHFVQTDSESWTSVMDKDHFFKDVELIESLDKFIGLIKKDRVLTGLDVAKYILCKVKCTHLKLEKLVYLCFAEYLCNYNKELYSDNIYAYKYGPVVDSVYNKYKGYGYKGIGKDDEEIDIDGISELPARSRILFAKDGIEKMKSIEDTIEKYGGLSASDLVNLTHTKDTPWFISGEGRGIDRVIENDIIKEYHCNEV